MNDKLHCVSVTQKPRQGLWGGRFFGLLLLQTAETPCQAGEKRGSKADLLGFLSPVAAPHLTTLTKSSPVSIGFFLVSFRNVGCFLVLDLFRILLPLSSACNLP
jgi:hypothetical protein